MKLEAGAKVTTQTRLSTKRFHSHWTPYSTQSRHTDTCVRAILLFVTPPLTPTVLIVFVNLSRNTRNSNGGRKKAVEPWKNCERTTNRGGGNSRRSRRCGEGSLCGLSGIPGSKHRGLACCWYFRLTSSLISKWLRKSVINNCPVVVKTLITYNIFFAVAMQSWILLTIKRGFLVCLRFSLLCALRN